MIIVITYYVSQTGLLSFHPSVMIFVLNIYADSRLYIIFSIFLTTFLQWRHASLKSKKIFKIISNLCTFFSYQVLEELEEVIKSNARNTTAMNNLTSKFFTLIPHNFGRKRPPTINDLEVLQKKMEMLMVCHGNDLFYRWLYRFLSRLLRIWIFRGLDITKESVYPGSEVSLQVKKDEIQALNMS